MKENPYSELIGMMQAQGNKSQSPSIKIARVVFVDSTDTKVLDVKIEVDDLTIDKDNLYISDYLLKEHKREIRTDRITELNGNTNIINDGGESSDHGHTVIDLIINSAKVYTKDTLKVNDLVAVMPLSDKQSYIILSRVVKI